MKRLLLSILISLPLSISAQDLVEFQNGQVADADAINANFESLKTQIAAKSGCSAEQDGNSVVISCSDGTSGVIPGTGTVVIVEGVDGETPDISNIPLDFYIVNGNGDPIATFVSGAVPLSGAPTIKIAGSPSLEASLHVFAGEDRVQLTSAPSTYLYWLVFASEDCSGPAFITQPGLQWLTEISAGVYGRNTSGLRTYWKSRRKPGYSRGGVYYPPSEVCEEIDQISQALLLQPYTPPDALLNPVFPLTVEALP